MTMPSVCFDASVIVSLFIADSQSARADVYIERDQPAPVISDFAAAEFVSAISLRVRSARLRIETARLALDKFDSWRASNATSCRLEHTDLLNADQWLRRLELPLRAPDALHIAIAQRLGFELATFDQQMSASALALGIGVANL
jgi:predicted nucleic acid-binding protein